MVTDALAASSRSTPNTQMARKRKRAGGGGGRRPRSLRVVYPVTDATPWGETYRHSCGPRDKSCDRGARPPQASATRHMGTKENRTLVGVVLNDDDADGICVCSLVQMPLFLLLVGATRSVCTRERGSGTQVLVRRAIREATASLVLSAAWRGARRRAATSSRRVRTATVAVVRTRRGARRRSGGARRRGRRARRRSWGRTARRRSTRRRAATRRSRGRAVAAHWRATTRRARAGLHG